MIGILSAALMMASLFPNLASPTIFQSSNKSKANVKTDTQMKPPPTVLESIWIAITSFEEQVPEELFKSAVAIEIRRLNSGMMTFHMSNAVGSFVSVWNTMNKPESSSLLSTAAYGVRKNSEVVSVVSQPNDVDLATRRKVVFGVIHYALELDTMQGGTLNLVIGRPGRSGTFSMKPNSKYQASITHRSADELGGTLVKLSADFRVVWQSLGK